MDLSPSSRFEQELGLQTCPSSSRSSLDYPSSTALAIFFSVLSLAFAVVVLLKYNYMVWLGDNTEIGEVSWRTLFVLFSNGDWVHDGGARGHTALHLASISNSYWILFFLAGGGEGVVHAMLYGVNSFHSAKDQLAYFTFGAWVVGTLVDLFLTLALLHQWYHRLGTILGGDLEEDSDEGQVKTFTCAYLRTPECLAMVLALLRMLAGWWAAPYIPDGSPYSHAYWVLAAAVLLQRFMAAVVTGFICFPRRGEDASASSPSTPSRLALAAGLLLSTPAALPNHIWSKDILSAAVSWHPCPLYIFSWLDIFFLFQLFAQGLFLYFIRSEFRRVSELEYYDMLQYYVDPITS